MTSTILTFTDTSAGCPARISLDVDDPMKTHHEVSVLGDYTTRPEMFGPYAVIYSVHRESDNVLIGSGTIPPSSRVTLRVTCNRVDMIYSGFPSATFNQSEGKCSTWWWIIVILLIFLFVLWAISQQRTPVPTT